MSEKEIFRIALDKAMTLCSRREFCGDDIRNKLSLWSIENDDVEKIIEILIRENFINESRYAAAFVRDKFKYNKWGKVKIAAHLGAKKLPSDVIRTALDSIDNEQYIKFLQGLIETHRKSIKAKNQYDLKAKLLRYGLSKGYESSLLYEILNDQGD
ncbi:MAG: regulatory protein RecX [Bacteroidales bacterium]